MAQTLGREFPFGFKGNIALLCDSGGTGVLFVLERPIRLLSVEAEAMNLLLKLDKFRFILIASSAMFCFFFSAGGRAVLGFFLCHHLMIINSEP